MKKLNLLFIVFTKMKNINRCLYLICLMIVSFSMTSEIIAQPCTGGTVLFNEDFEGEADAATSGTDVGGVAWTATCPGCVAGDFFEVDSNTGNATGCNGTNGLRGNDTNGPGTFNVSGLDVSSCAVIYFSFDYCSTGYTGSGNLECFSECGTCSGVPSEGVSNGSCNNCWDFLYGELDWGSGSSQQILLGDDCNAPTSGSSGSAICGTTDENGDAIPPADLTSVDINIVMAMWAGTENMVIDNVSVICYTAAEVSACADTDVTDACPACDLAPITATNVDCNDGGTPSDTSDDFITFDLNVTGTSVGATYGIDGGVMPAMGNAYASNVSFSAPAGSAGGGDLSLTVTDVNDGMCTEVVMITDPGSCESCDPAIAAATAPAAVITSESMCQADNVTLNGGVIGAPVTACPTGSTLEYSLDMGAWSTTLPMYDQMNSVQVDTRCACDFDGTITSNINTIMTTPGACPTCDPIIVDARPVCSADGTTYDIMINSITGGDGSGTDFTVTDGTTTITYPGTTMLTGLAYTDQNTKVTLTVADADLTTCSVTYDVLQLNCEAQEVCDCTGCNTGAYTINAQAAGNGNGFSMLYVLIDATGNVSAINTTGNFSSLMDVDANGTPIVYEVYAINVLDGDLAGIQGAIAVGAPFDPADAAFDAFCFDASCNAMFMENCECLPEPLLTCPTTVDLCGNAIPLNLSDGNVNTAGNSIVIYGGTCAPFIDNLGTTDITDDVLDPALASALGTYNLTVQLQSADGCLSPEVECIIVFTTNCDAEGGKFDEE